MKKVIQVAVKEPQYVVSTDVAFAQVDAWFGHTVRDLKLRRCVAADECERTSGIPL